MLTKELDYNLPEELIAKFPPKTRGNSKLLIVDRDNGTFEKRVYTDCIEYMKRGDVVILNKTKVLKARIFPTVKRTNKQIEMLYLNNIQYDSVKYSASEYVYWYVLVKGARRIKEGDIFVLEDIEIFVLHRKDGDPGFIVAVKKEDAGKIFNKYGHVPLPPYMRRNDTPEDNVRYNTVFARIKGSVAAPTASLNITPDLLRQFRNNGIEIAYINLKISWGTFAPIRTKMVEDFKIHSEFIEISNKSAQTINRAMGNGADIFSFGTTATRAVESAYDKSTSSVQPFRGFTDLFIYPGYKWQVVDHLITNFHAPNTSLLALVMSFMGSINLTKKAYKFAVDNRMKFLSYGDSMLIL